MKIAQVLQSGLDLNNLKFGGAERVVRNYHKILNRHHHSFIIHFKSVSEIENEIASIDPHVVMCHSDDLTNHLATMFENICFIHISHNPYAEDASSSVFKWIKWHKVGKNLVEVLRDLRMIQKYRSQIKGLIRRDNVIVTALSRRISVKSISFGLKAPFDYLPNPIDEYEFDYRSVERLPRLLCVGKVDLRKRQYLVQKNILDVDFVGPARDTTFDYNDHRYLGELDHEKLHQLMLTYDGLILASDGEAMPQVLFEAMLCGMRLYLTNGACWDFDNKEPIININDNLKNLGKSFSSSLGVITEKQRKLIRSSVIEAYSVNNDNFYDKYLYPLLHRAIKFSYK